ncbi:Cupredoxin [Sesbania bispinosa]|nr:Cupredoxin [Sesbania bispinosa]
MAELGQVSHRLLGLLLLMLLILINSSQAKKFEVGGKDGWVEKPSKDYNHWAKRNIFQVK